MTTTSYNIYQQITSVRLASTENFDGFYFNGQINNGIGATLTASSVGSLMVDSVDANVGDRIFLKNQDNPNEDGIYVVMNAGSPISLWVLQRAPDFQSTEQLKAGQYFTVGAGETLAGSEYVLIEPIPEQIGINNFNISNVSSGSGGPFLEVANNLSDLSNRKTAFSNLGLGSGQQLSITDSDFIGNLYSLTNPCPNYITILCSNPGNTIRLPSAQGTESFELSQGPNIQIPFGFQSVDVASQSGSSIATQTSPSFINYTLSDNSTSDGTWIQEFKTTLVQGSISGTLDFVSLDSSINIDASTGHINLTTTGGTNILIAQQLWVNFSNGNDSNDGNINAPLKSWDAAHALAVANANSSNQYLIHAIGDQFPASDFVISPFVHVDGHNSGEILPTTGQIVADSSWSSSTASVSFVKNCKFVASNNLNFNFGSGLENIVYFDYCDFDQVPACIISANNTNASPNDVLMTNTIFSSGSGPFAGGTAVQDALLIIKNSPVQNLAVTCTGAGGSAGATAVLVNCTMNGSMQVTDSGTGAQASISLQSTPMNTSTIISGTNATLFVNDVSSYTNIPTFLSGATISQVIINSLSDGLVQTSYTPVNFTPDNTGGNYKLDSMTAMIHGIDNALSSAGSPDVFSAYSSVVQSSVTGDGTIYTIIVDTQIGTTSPNINLSTGVYTAPSSGDYQFSSGCNLSNLDSSNNIAVLYLVTPAGQYVMQGINPVAIDVGGTAIIVSGAATVHLNAGDTAHVAVQVSGGSKTVDVFGDLSGNFWTYFSGSALKVGGGSGSVNVTDDNTTNATTYPLIVHATPGSQPVYTSSNWFQFNPFTACLTSLCMNIGTTSTNNTPLMFDGSTGRKIKLFEDSNTDDNQYHGFGIGSSEIVYQVPDTTHSHVFRSGINSVSSYDILTIDGHANVTLNETDSGEANLFINRTNFGSRLRIEYQTSGTALWSVGVVPSDNTLWFYNEIDGAAHLRLVPGSGTSGVSIFQSIVNIESLATTQLVATDGSQNLISVPYGTDVNGITISTETGSTGATVLNSQSKRMGNVGTSTGKINFTATATSGNVLINPPFGTAFTASDQAAGTSTINKSSGANIGDGIVAIVNSVSGQGLQFNWVVATGSGLYDLYFSVQYTINN